MKKTLILSLALAVLPGFSYAQDGFSTPWVKGLNAQARLVLAGGPVGNRYHLGVEIALLPKNITYWRNPGAAGVPPTFDFSASENLINAVVHYPAPLRILEAGNIEAFGYLNDVIFPVDVQPRDPAKPVSLTLRLNYAACEKICVPLHAEMTLALRPAPVSSSFAAPIAAALAKVPVDKSGDAQVQRAVVGPLAAMPPSWRIDSAPLHFTATDLFVEAPDGFDMTTSVGGAPNTFALALAHAPEGADLHAIPVHLTATGPQSAIEWDTTLDAHAIKP